MDHYERVADKTICPDSIGARADKSELYLSRKEILSFFY